MALSGRLRAFAQDLAPSQNEVIRAGKTIDVIARSIHAHFKGRGVVDRITPFGSYPKKTSISGSMDVDIIVYINNKDPPFHGIIDDLYGIVRRQFDSSCKKNSYGVCFSYKGLKVDLLPAKNFLPSSSSHDPNVGRSARGQYARALDYVKRKVSPSERDWYSTSMSGISVLFEQNRDSFSHCMSRLAKYWSSTVVRGDSMRGHSSIMEYLGTYAAQQERASYRQDMYQAFRRFLKLFEFPDSINIYWTEFYTWGNIPDYVMTQRPLLLDPCNPYNNLLNIKGADNANILQRMGPYAKTTLARLDEAFNRRYDWNIKGIFQEDFRPTRRLRLLPSPQPVPFTRFDHWSYTRSEESVCSISCVCRYFFLFVVCCLCLFVFLRGLVKWLMPWI